LSATWRREQQTTAGERPGDSFSGILFQGFLPPRSGDGRGDGGKRGKRGKREGEGDDIDHLICQ